MSKSGSGDTKKYRIYNDLRRSIGVGHRKPGERIDLEELSKDYGISITPVRDALQMLGQEGLVTIEPRSGYFVTHITLKQLYDMLDLREILEVASIERAIVRITEEQLKQLEHVHAGYTDEGDESYIRYMSENRNFHYLIAEASGNHELAKDLGSLLDRLLHFMILCRVGKMLENRHSLVIEALRSRDIAKARNTIISEVNQTRESILEHVIEEEGVILASGQMRIGANEFQEKGEE